MKHLFIINPLSGARMDNLFSTHPDTGNRIRALMAMADGGGFGRRNPEPAMDGPWTAPRGSRGGPWGGSGSAGRPSNRGPWG